MSKSINQIIKIARNQNKQLQMHREIARIERTTNKIKLLTENARQLNEIILVDALPDLTVEEKYKTVMDIANYYVQHLEDKIIELDASGKHI